MLDDLPLLRSDFGQTLVVGGLTIEGVLTDLQPVELDGEVGVVLATERSLLAPTAELPALAIGMTLTLDGVLYIVQRFGPDADTLDGALTRIWVEAV